MIIATAARRPRLHNRLLEQPVSLVVGVARVEHVGSVPGWRTFHARLRMKVPGQTPEMFVLRMFALLTVASMIGLALVAALMSTPKR